MGLRLYQYCFFRPQTRVLAGLVALGAGLALVVGWSLAPEAVAKGTKTSVAVAEPAKADPHAGMLLTRQRSEKRLNQIYEFDRLPLGKRVPVILVPGRAEEFQHNSWWKDFNRTAHRNPFFRHNFKLYVFLYNSKEELDVQAQSLAEDLRRRFGHLDSKTQPLMLVTYSLGGVITREVMANPAMLDRIDTQIAVAVPFHGSPIFDPHWFSQYLNPPNRSPVRRFWDRTIYRGYMWGKSNLTRGLRWDNFDRSKPQFDAQLVQVAGDQVRSHQSGKADSTAESAAKVTEQVQIPVYTEYPMADEIRAKTVIYASYLENGYTRSNQPFNPLKLPKYVLENSITMPKELVATVLPVYGVSVHSVFTYMNNLLANLPTYTPEDPQGKNTHLYRFNDGAIPLSSMLFLKPADHPYDDDLEGLISHATVRAVRIFVNIDHMHIGEYSMVQKRVVRPDILHPEEGQRSPNEWIIRDLNTRLQLLQGQSTQPQSMPSPHPKKPVSVPETSETH